MTKLLETELYEYYIRGAFHKKGISFDVYKTSFMQSKDAKGVELELNIINTTCKEFKEPT